MAISDSLAKSILQNLQEELGSSTFYDVLIRVQNKEFKSHKLILSANSKYFKNIFTTERDRISSAPIILKNITPETFRLVLDCIYGGKDVLTAANLVEIWHAAVYLEIDFLYQACELYQSSRVTKENCVEMANQAKTFKSKKLKEAAWNMIIKEFNDISRREDFFLLESEDLLQVINSEDLAVDSEDYVINAIVKWVQHSPEVSDRKFYDDSEKDYKSREKQPQRENSSLKKRKNDIVDMLKASRLCLASRSCLQSLLDVHVIAENNKCFSVMRQALQYHLQPENHGYHCPSQAIHRASSKFENVILSVSQCKEYNLSCRALDGTWYHMSSPPHIPTDVVSYGINIYSFGNQGNAYDYYEYNGFTNMYKYCTALGKWKALPGLVNDDTFSLIGLDRYLYAVSNIIYRLIITDGASEEWENVGKIQFFVHPIILSTCGSSIVILGNDRKSDQFKVQLFDTLTLTCCVYTDQLPFEMINLVTFRVFNDSYILLSTGEVLKLVTCDKNKIQFENKGKLFERPLTLNAAVAFKDSLIIAASNYPQPNIKRETDIIDHVKTVELIDRPSRGLFNTTIPKIQLVNKDLNYTDVGKGFRRQGKKY